MRGWVAKGELPNKEQLKEYNVNLKRYAAIFPKLKIDENTNILVTEKEVFENEEWDKFRISKP